MSADRTPNGRPAERSQLGLPAAPAQVSCPASMTCAVSDGWSGTHVARVSWAEDGAAVRIEVNGLPDATAAAIVNSREDWLGRKVPGLD